MKFITLKDIRFRNKPFGEVIEHLRQTSIEKDPSGQGVNFIMRLGSMKPSDLPNITFSARRLDMYDVLRAVTSVADMQFRISGNIVWIEPKRGKK